MTISKAQHTERKPTGSNPVFGGLWALMAGIAGYVCLFLTAYGFSWIARMTVETAEMLAYICYDLIIASSCFLICRRYPKSTPVVPVLANLMGIASAIAEPHFWESSIWVLVFCGWILSIIASLAGLISKNPES